MCGCYYAGILDSGGNTVVEYLYNAWGQEVGRGGSMWQTLGELNPFRYRGYYYDIETGFYYLNSRYYDPEIGRFLNADGLIYCKDAIPVNLFKYCDNSPVASSDPNGFWTIGIGVTGNGTLGAGYCYQSGWYWDGHGWPKMLESHSFQAGASCDIGGALFLQWTNLESVDQLLGDGYSAGASIGAKPYFGADLVYQGGKEHEYDDPIGFQLQGGVGAGVDIHGNWTKTSECKSRDIFHTATNRALERTAVCTDIQRCIGLTKVEYNTLKNCAERHDYYTYEQIRPLANYLFPIKGMR